MAPTRFKRGFTLAEMMLAVSLFAIGTVAAMEALQKAQAGATDGENVLTATYLAQQRMEELKNVPFAAVASEPKAAVASPGGFGRFSREVVVASPSPSLKQVTVRMYWAAPGGEASVVLETYRSAF